jgi:small subunit ribosomal protein S21
MSRVDVVDNQVDAAPKQLKKLLIRDGAFQEMKWRTHYETPRVKRKRKAAAARKRRRRALARARGRDPE